MKQKLLKTTFRCFSNFQLLHRMHELGRKWIGIDIDTFLTVIIIIYFVLPVPLHTIYNFCED